MINLPARNKKNNGGNFSHPAHAHKRESKIILQIFGPQANFFCLFLDVITVKSKKKNVNDLLTQKTKLPCTTAPHENIAQYLSFE